MKTKKKQVPILLYPSLILVFFCLSLLYIFGEPTSYIWVMDWDSPANIGHLVKMCPNGHKLFQFPLGITGGIAIDPRNGTVLAPRLYNQGVTLNQVLRIREDGTILDIYGGYQMGGVDAIDSKDGSIWTTASTSQMSYLLKLNSQGKPIANINNFEYHSPFVAAINSLDDTIWVIDNSNTDRGELIHLTSNGQKLLSLKTTGIFAPSWAPQLVIAPLDGDIWYEESEHGNLYELNADGQLLLQINDVTHPISLAMHPSNGTIWIVNENSNYSSGSLLELNSQGKIIQRVVLLGRPTIVQINPYDGSIWVGALSKMIHLSSDGKIVKQENGFSNPQSIAFAPSNGDLLTKLTCAFYFYF